MADDTSTPSELVQEAIRDAEYHAGAAWIKFDNDKPWHTAEHLMAAEAAIQRARLLMVEIAKASAA